MEQRSHPGHKVLLNLIFTLSISSFAPKWSKLAARACTGSPEDGKGAGREGVLGEQIKHLLGGIRMGVGMRIWRPPFVFTRLLLI